MTGEISFLVSKRSAIQTISIEKMHFTCKVASELTVLDFGDGSCTSTELALSYCLLSYLESMVMATPPQMSGYISVYIDLTWLHAVLITLLMTHGWLEHCLMYCTKLRFYLCKVSDDLIKIIDFWTELSTIQEKGCCCLTGAESLDLNWYWVSVPCGMLQWADASLLFWKICSSVMLASFHA